MKRTFLVAQRQCLELVVERAGSNKTVMDLFGDTAVILNSIANSYLWYVQGQN